MGEWRLDQSKGAKRYVWGQTRGVDDSTRRNLIERMKPYAVFKNLRVEKIGSEIHCWREMTEETGKKHWISCLRFVPDDWGYWDVFYRTDERRWRTTDLQELPIGRMIERLAEFYSQKFVI
jgi:hypothetical protein